MSGLGCEMSRAADRRRRGEDMQGQRANRAGLLDDRSGSMGAGFFGDYGECVLCVGG